MRSEIRCSIVENAVKNVAVNYTRLKKKAVCGEIS